VKPFGIFPFGSEVDWSGVEWNSLWITSIVQEEGMIPTIIVTWFRKWNRFTTLIAQREGYFVFRFAIIPLLITMGIVTSKVSTWRTICSFVPLDNVRNFAEIFLPDFSTIGGITQD